MANPFMQNDQLHDPYIIEELDMMAIDNEVDIRDAGCDGDDDADF